MAFISNFLKSAPAVGSILYFLGNLHTEPNSLYHVIHRLLDDFRNCLTSQLQHLRIQG